MPLCAISHPRLIEPGPHWEVLESGDFEITVPDDPGMLKTGDGLAAFISRAEAVVAGTESFSGPVMDQAKHLRVIARCGVGYDAIDVPAATERGIVVSTTPGTNEHSVAETALAMIVAISRGFPGRDLMVRQRRPWQKVPIPRLAGQTAGIVGLGRIGRALSWRLLGLQMHVVAYDPLISPESAPDGVELVGLDQLWERSDFISLHLPLNQDTSNLVSARTISLMKPGVVIINTARGGLIHETDLLAALQSGRVSAAGLDVFVEEPIPPDHPFLDQENILLSPHAAGVDCESDLASKRMVAQIIVDLHRGKWPVECLVNGAGLENWSWTR